MANGKINFRYTIVLRPESEGGFTVTVPALPGCVTFGKNLSEAKRMAADAIYAYISSLKKHHEPIPSDDESVIASVEVSRASGARSLAHA